MSDLAQWIAHQRRAAVFGTSEETVLALLDVAEALAAANGVMWMAREYAEAGGSCGPEMQDFTDAQMKIDAALARLVEVKHG